MPESEEAAGKELHASGVTLEFRDETGDDYDLRYSDALELSDPQEIQRVALSLIEERADV